MAQQRAETQVAAKAAQAERSAAWAKADEVDRSSATSKSQGNTALPNQTKVTAAANARAPSGLALATQSTKSAPASTTVVASSTAQSAVEIAARTATRRARRALLLTLIRWWNPLIARAWNALRFVPQRGGRGDHQTAPDSNRRVKQYRRPTPPPGFNE